MSRLVEAARKYLDVPFRHRGRSARALDCAGLGVLAFADCGVALPDIKHYGREPHDDRLMQALIAALGEPVGHGPLAEVQTGDVVVINYNGEPHHVGIIGETPYGAPSLIHADSRVGKVVEHRFDAVWRARMSAVFRRAVP